MKNRFIPVLAALLLSAVVQAQNTSPNPESSSAAMSSPSTMTGGLSLNDTLSQLAAFANYTRIGDQDFVGMRFRPELAFGKVGVGLDVPLLFNLKTGDLRTEEYKNGVGLLRMVRYVRYGTKRQDPIYIKVGDLTGSYLGFGLLVNNYSNQVSFERRKIGANFDVKLTKKLAIEGIYSDLDFSSFNMLALRPYYKPFQGSMLPIIKNMEFGASLVMDHDKTSQWINDSLSIKPAYTSQSGMYAVGLDVGTFLIQNRFLNWSAYAQWGMLMRNASDSLDHYVKANGLSYATGTGVSIGTSARFRFIADILTVQARLERIVHSTNFIPQFFDMVYEANKDGRIRQLASSEASSGTFGRLDITLLNKILVNGGLLMPDYVSVSHPAMVQVGCQLPQLSNITIVGHYIKSGLTNLNDAFVLDERSQASVRVGYRFNAFITAGLDYRWTFARDENGQFKPVSWVMPYFGIHYPLNLK